MFSDFCPKWRRASSPERAALGSPVRPPSSYLALNECAGLRLGEPGRTGPQGPLECPWGRRDTSVGPRRATGSFAVGPSVGERQRVSVSPRGCQWAYFCVPCVSALLSVSLVCLAVAVWVGKSLCVSEPGGRRAEPQQVATGKSRQVRVGGCEVGRGWMKASEYTRGAEQRRG